MYFGAGWHWLCQCFSAISSVSEEDSPLFFDAAMSLHVNTRPSSYPPKAWQHKVICRRLVREGMPTLPHEKRHTPNRNILSAVCQSLDKDSKILIIGEVCSITLASVSRQRRHP